MASVLMLNRQKKIVGTVEYLFTERPMASYRSLPVENDGVARFNLAESTLYSTAGHALAGLVCGTNDRGGIADVVVLGTVDSRLGHIEGATAKIKEGDSWRSVGGVHQRRVRGDVRGIAGELFLQWDAGDEDYFHYHVQEYANAMGIPTNESRKVFDACRPALYQNLMDFAGCSALILQLFTNGKALELPRYSRSPIS